MNDRPDSLAVRPGSGPLEQRVLAVFCNGGDPDIEVAKILREMVPVLRQYALDGLQPTARTWSKLKDDPRLQVQLVALIKDCEMAQLACKCLKGATDYWNTDDFRSRLAQHPKAIPLSLHMEIWIGKQAMKQALRRSTMQDMEHTFGNN
jgi:hypothetical protein